LKVEPTMKRGSPRTIRSPRRFGVLAALFAILIQAVAVQTHVHALPSAAFVIGVESSAGAVASDPQLAHDQRAACVLCQTLASSGRGLLAVGVMLAAPDAATLDAVAPIIASLPPPPAHAWRSRAPPLSL
jgi:hypothetical protein